MTRSVDDCIAIFKALISWSSHFTDGAIKFKALDTNRLENFDDTFKIAYVESLDNICAANLAARRGVREAVEISKKLGHEVVKLDYDFGPFYSALINAITVGNKIK